MVAPAVFGAAAIAQDNIKVIRAARLLDVKRGKYIEKPPIVIEGGRIEE
ncbi:MAG: hypothetical protein JNL98_43580, partial [Bryobacterales bacterium]|nr:hypothetical protein [Bryobacterales bacterium]